MSEERISESQLIIPALMIMSHYHGGISTTELEKQLRKIMQPQGKDLEISPNRNDDRFSQKVRNLVSHHTLEQKELASREDGKFFIVQKGIELLENRLEEYEYINSGYFTGTEREEMNKKLVDNDAQTCFLPENEIKEGELGKSSGTTRKRSAKLRKYALDYYKKNGGLHCNICGFDFEKTYGKYGKDFIELHHIKPISLYEKDGKITNLEQARKNLTPLCSNCHRILHRNNMSCEELKTVFVKG